LVVGCAGSVVTRILFVEVGALLNSPPVPVNSICQDESKAISTSSIDRRHSSKITMTKQHVQLVEYLFTRLHQLGIKAVHGVPGDYNLVALDYLENAGLKWIGDANELNAGMFFARLHDHARLVAS